jgi:hypothetical protein
LSTNGLLENGFWVNGFWVNGFWVNGFWVNGFWVNGFWVNGFWVNGFWVNGAWTNGLWSNGFWVNGFDGTPNVAGQMLRSNPYARQLLQYVYSCAMPADGFDTTLDPNLATPISCAPTPAGADGGVDSESGGGSGCDLGYECSSEGKCVIPLHGGGANGSGLAINSDGTTWWGQPAPGGATDTTTGKWGQCDESCQRWVSACVLARTNAYGVHVQISMRAPADAPAPIKTALAVGDDERAEFTLREGAYYGNIFATTPTSASKGSCTTLADGTTACQPVGPVASTPAYYACAGPGSNIPEVTKRFCSSQGDQVVINVPGLCLPKGTERGVCLGEDIDPGSPTFGAVQDCFTSTHRSPPVFVGPGPYPQPPVEYNQVLTVFLRQPLSVCGNQVCEPPEDANSCPNDCHPGSWAISLDPSFDSDASTVTPPFEMGTTPDFNQFGMAAVGPDDTIVVVGDTPSDVNLGGVVLPATDGAGVLVKYTPGGDYAWPGRGIRFPNVIPAGSQLPALPTGIAIKQTGPDAGTIALVGRTYDVNNNYLWLRLYTAAGVEIGTWSWLGGSFQALQAFGPGRGVAFDSSGNIVVAAYYSGTVTLATTPPTMLTSGPAVTNLVAKISPQGEMLWAQPVTADQLVSSLALDQDDDIILTALHVSSGLPPAPSLVRLCADGTTGTAGQCPDGSASWSKGFGALGTFTDAVVDEAGNIYAGGAFAGTVDFGAGPPSPTPSGFPPFLVKYDRNGTLLWASNARNVCLAGPSSCSGEVWAANIAFDTQRNPVISAWGNPGVGGGIDFGAGVFPTYGATNMFVAAYSPNSGAPLWSKQIPTILGSAPRGMALDSQGRIVMSGIYGGSMEVDADLLVTPVPEQESIVSPFVASFAGPPPSDETPPGIGQGTDGTAAPISTVPQDIVVPATNGAGATVFYMPPTAVDTGYSGASVVCTPPPNTLFRVGTTTVRCVAFDPRGNTSDPKDGTFTITVVDTVGPVFSTVADVSAAAAGPDGAHVAYTQPTATDQVDGAVPVTCAPTSGTLFPIGPTTVNCTASDKSKNQSRTTFTVSVSPQVVASCVGAPGAPVTIPTATGTCFGPVNAADAGSCSGSGTQVACTFDGASSESLGVGDHAVSVVAATTGGSTSTCTSYVRISDGEKPTIACAGQTAECAGPGGTPVAPTATCTDNCSCTTSCIAALFPVGTSSGSCTATDSAGNTATCSPAVTVVDNTAPLVTPRPGPSQLQCNVDAWTDPGAVAFDVCAGDLSGNVQTSGTVDPTHVGSYIESYSAVDPSGNKGAATRTVTVVDTLAPTLALNPSAATLQCGVDNYIEAGAKATDTCAGDLTSNITATGAVVSAAPGKYTVSYSVADPSGNTTQASRTLNVVDTLPPTISAIEGPSTTADHTININITSYTVTPTGGGTTMSGSASCWTAPGIAITLNATDACALKQLVYALSGAQIGGASVSSGTASLTVTKTGSTTVSYYATDEAGNQSAAQTIPIYVGHHPLGFGFSCAPSVSLKSLPPHGLITAKGTVTITAGKQTTTQPFSFTQSY